MLNAVALATDGYGFGAEYISIEGYWTALSGPALEAENLAVSLFARSVSLTRLVAAVTLLERTMVTLEGEAGLAPAVEASSRTLEENQTTSLSASTTDLGLDVRTLALNVDDD